jgi:hypothetical protein
MVNSLDVLRYPYYNIFWSKCQEFSLVFYEKLNDYV